MTITSSTTDVCSISSGQVSFVGVGTCTLNANQEGDANWSEAVQVTQTFQVNRATPSTPSISNIPTNATEFGSYVASVSTSGDGATSVTSISTAVCTVGADGHTITFVGFGVCTLTANVAQGTNYLSGTGSSQSFPVNPAARGYWLVGSDGGIFSFGAAAFYGSMGGTPLQRPVVGITPSASRTGYWLVASDGGIFSFGNSSYYGSIPGSGCILPARVCRTVSMPPSSAWCRPSPGAGTSWWRPMAASSPSATPTSRDLPGHRRLRRQRRLGHAGQHGEGLLVGDQSRCRLRLRRRPFYGRRRRSQCLWWTPSPPRTGVATGCSTPTAWWTGSATPTTQGAPLGYVNGFNPASAIFPTADGKGYWVASGRVTCSPTATRRIWAARRLPASTARSSPPSASSATPPAPRLRARAAPPRRPPRPRHRATRPCRCSAQQLRDVADQVHHVGPRGASDQGDGLGGRVEGADLQDHLADLEEGRAGLQERCAARAEPDGNAQFK